ncbi:hypothetical protein FY034_00210 [Trichlorobacter lovleyi]|uniref:hypothetical protein n=1 Tax=Trichlorobacter lovleyi TaxID=313985 RepID=UPI0022408F95|nr:hypothetical protein [Trichlorobacter lovleyi]QOX77430.1 hypothetical protein FY034_00210 [Trichlorobacter lovleyi]
MTARNHHRIRCFCCCLLLLSCVLQLVAVPACQASADSPVFHTLLGCDTTDENGGPVDPDEDDSFILLPPLQQTWAAHAVTPLQIPSPASPVYRSLYTPPE